MKLLNHVYPISSDRISDIHPEPKSSLTALLNSIDTFQKSRSQPVKFAGAGMSRGALKNFSNALQEDNPEQACEMVRKGEISVNREVVEPPHGEPRRTLFEWVLREYICLSLLREMLKVGADLKKEDGHGAFPIHRVARFWPSGAVQILVEGGADVNQPDRDGVTALDYAARYRSQEMVKTLITNGAIVNAVKRGSGRTPLFTAIPGGNVQVIAALLEHGALTNIQDTDGKTPLEMALDRAKFLGNLNIPPRYNLPAIVNLLLAHGAVFPNEQTKQEYCSLLKIPAYNAYFKELPVEAIKPHVQYDLPHPDEPRPLNQQFPDTEDHRNYRKAVLEVFRERVQQQGASHPLYHLYVRPKKTPKQTTNIMFGV